MIGADHLTDRTHHLVAGGGDDHDLSSCCFVLGDQLDGFVVDQWVDDLVQSLVDDVADLLHVPPGTHRGQVVAHPVHLVFVGAGEGKDELGVGAAQHGATIDQTALIEGFSERESARLGDDRLVEVEKCRRFAHATEDNQKSNATGGLVHRPLRYPQISASAPGRRLRG